MLFSTRPKESREDLYDREREIEILKDSIRRKDWIAVLGIKRVGKTSVVNVAVRETDSMSLKLNLMKLHDPRRKKYPRENFISLILENVNGLVKSYTMAGRVVRIISNVLGIDEESFMEFNIIKIKPRLKKFRKEDLTYLFRELDTFAKDNKKILTIVFDEAQELVKISEIDFPSLFHDIYDYCQNTVVIFTGSMIRVVESVLKNIEYKEPFFGRYIRRVSLPKFTEEQSKDFLRRGFEEEGIKVSEDIIDYAWRKFDGIPGWLTFFGSEYSVAVKHGLKPDIDRIVSNTIKEIKEEVINFLKYSQSMERYSAIILALDRLGGEAELREIRKIASSLLNEEIPAPRIYEMLNRLLNYSLIEKSNNKYSLPKDEPNRIGMTLAAKEFLK
jgi:AAA+ ATPase superfamily predicted ATPase